MKSASTLFVEPEDRLRALRHWAEAQQFSPPWWLRQPDVQTAWYVIREIAAALKDRRASSTLVWDYVVGQHAKEEKISRNPEGVTADAEASRPGRPLINEEVFPVNIPFDDDGYLTAILHLTGDRRRLAILFHGLEGSIEATYMRGASRELLRKGISVLRVNMVNCGGSEGCSRRFYHAGFTLMLEIAVQWAITNGFERVTIVGFSLSANLVLKYLGGSNFSGCAEVCGGVAVCPPIDLAQGVAQIDRPRNVFYRYRFLKSMLKTLEKKQRLFPDLFPVPVTNVKTIAEFDDRYTARACGFPSGREYYRRTSSLPYLNKIALPTLLLHSQDDIFIPFDAFRRFDWQCNPCLITLFPRHGGHVGFHSSARENWMERSIAEFAERLTHF
ncbi:MAG TPA: alpha/beta fold hydrolase [Acidobacteriota bacterium]|jgi:hypothetical protein